MVHYSTTNGTELEWQDDSNISDNGWKTL